MRYLILVFFLNPSVQARQIICQHNLRDVAIVLNQDKSQLTVQIHSPMGYDYLPLVEGPIRPSMKNWLSYQFQQLKVLGSSFKIEFPNSKCDWEVSKNSKVSKLQCSEAHPTPIKNLRFHTLSISHVIEKGFKQETHYRKFRMSVSVNGEYGEDTFFISIPVPEVGCQERE